MNNKRNGWAVGLLLSLNAVTASASLIDRGNGLLYDDVLNVTWLQDANYAKTSGYDSDGKMDWFAATAWAAGLSYQGYDDWRLPGTTDTGTSGCDYANSGTDCGQNVDTASSELAYMYFVNLGLKSYVNASGIVQPDYGVFGNGTLNGVDNSSYGQNDVGLVDNLQNYAYWSGSENASSTYYAWYAGTSDAWYFNTNSGTQGAFSKVFELSAWAVRPGDVAAIDNPIPEPGSLALIGLGLMALRRARR